MAEGRFKSILDVFGLNEDIDDEDYLDDEEELDFTPKKSSRQARKEAREETAEREPAPQKPRQSARSQRPKVVPFSGSQKTMRVEIVKATSFDDAQGICSLLLDGKPVIVNLEGFQPSLAQRTMDFICGCMFAIDGKFHQISHNIFLFSPSNVDISGDSVAYSGDGTTQAPTISTDF